MESPYKWIYLLSQRVFRYDVLLRMTENEIKQPGRGFHFQPFKPQYRHFVMKDLPDSPVELFQLFCPEDLIKKWVIWTNDWVAFQLQAKEATLGKHARLRSWTTISVAEVYIWLACLIYIGIHTKKRVRDHWKTFKAGEMHPTDPIVGFMTFNRFQLILRYIRIFPPFETIDCSVQRMISHVSEWSDLIQATSTDLFLPGLSIAVDECMIRFTGRSKAKVTIPRKPTPTGLKIWVAAQKGYFLRWRFHIPASSRPRGIAAKRRAEKRELAETQAVVLDLALQLPIATYHVFFDNLFTTPQLLLALRKRGIAATGTARLNSGLYAPFVVAKTADNKGQLKNWKFNELRAVPMVDDLVREPKDIFLHISLINISLYSLG